MILVIAPKICPGAIPLEPELFFYVQLIMSLVHMVVFRGGNQDVIYRINENEILVYR